MSDPISFPFEPYPQQRDLMRSLYECIEKSSVGCFESPTGTGKSLSVICATLSWQYKEEKRILDEQLAASLKTKTKTDDDWLMAFQSSFQNDTTESKKKKRAYDLHLLMKDRVQRASAIKPSLQSRDNQFWKKTLKATDSTNLNSDDVQEAEDEFSLEHYDSSDELNQSKAKKSTNSSISRADCSDSEDDEDISTSLGLPKIYYCSRTHSQISQFVSEIKRTVFTNARCITLGSRRNMCINSDVTKLRSDSKMSEMCLEMQKSKSKGSTSIDDDHLDSRKQRKLKVNIKPCQHHKKMKEEEFANHALGKIRDIESLVSLGDDLGACPYYATRRAISDAQVMIPFFLCYYILSLFVFSVSFLSHCLSYLLSLPILSSHLSSHVLLSFLLLFFPLSFTPLFESYFLALLK